MRPLPRVPFLPGPGGLHFTVQAELWYDLRRNEPVRDSGIDP